MCVQLTVNLKMHNEAEFSLDLMPHQAMWMDTPATEIFVGGAAGPGKSHFLRAVSIHFALMVPGIQIILFRRKYPDLIKNHLQGPASYYVMLAKLIQLGIAKIVGGNPPTVSFRNGTYGDWETGSKIQLNHLQHEKDLSSHQGPEYHIAMFDELTHFEESMYRFIRGRLRIPGLAIPEEYAGQLPKLISASNPGSIGHGWVKHTFIDNAQPFEIREMEDDEGGMNRIFMPARMEDNTHLDSDTYRKQLRGLGNPVLVKAMEEGDWDIAPGAIFSDVWNKEVHIVEPFIIPSSWYIDRSFDWGWSRPFSVGWWAQSDGTTAYTKDGHELNFPRGTLFRIAEWYGWNKKPNVGLKMTARDIAKGVAARERSMGLKYVSPGVADASIFDNINEMCLADEMEEEGITWEKANKRPGTRKVGLMLMLQLFQNATSQYKELPAMYIWKNCTNFIRTIPVLPSLEGDPDDIDTKSEDHIYDETRYRVLDTGFSYDEISIGGV